MTFVSDRKTPSFWHLASLSTNREYWNRAVYTTAWADPALSFDWVRADVFTSAMGTAL